MKRILGLTIAFMLLIGMVGIGTFAYFSDAETAYGNQLSAGTLDLKTNDADGVSQTLYATNIAPGETIGPQTITLRNGGRMMAVGIASCEDMVSFPLFIAPFQANTIEGVLYGSLRHQIDIPRLAEMALKGDLKLDKMITEHCKLEDINEVMDAMEKRKIIGRWVFDL